MAADKYGSIVFVTGRRRAYGIRATLHLPTDYFVYDTDELIDVIARTKAAPLAAAAGVRAVVGAALLPASLAVAAGPIMATAAGRAAVTKADIDEAVKFNYFDAYFSLSGTPDGEAARVEAGVFKYSGPTSKQWNPIRTGVAGITSDFHGELFRDEVFAGKPHAMQLAFKPGDKNVIELKLDGHTIYGPMTLNEPIAQATFDAGGLYPKASIGICNFGGKIRFSKMTLANLQINHDSELKEIGWKPFTDYSKHNKFTHGDWIESQNVPFAGWTRAAAAGHAQPARPGHGVG